MRIFRNTVFFLIGVCISCVLVFLAEADTKTTADVTENSAGAETSCSTRCTNWNFDPRTDIHSDGGDDDDIVYWDHHGELIQITIIILIQNGRLPIRLVHSSLKKKCFRGLPWMLLLD